MYWFNNDVWIFYVVKVSDEPLETVKMLSIVRTVTKVKIPSTFQNNFEKLRKNGPVGAKPVLYKIIFVFLF